MTDENAAIRTQFRRVLGLDDRSAIIGDSSGVIYEPGRSGYVRVRFPSSDGFSYPTVVRLGITAALTSGLPVKVGWRDDELQVKALDNKGMDAGNWNGYTPSVTNKETNAVDLNTSPIFISTPFGASHPLYVTLFPLMYVKNGVIHAFGGVSGGIDLSSYIPGSADQWCVVGIFLTPSDTSEVVSSTAQSTSEPLTSDDLQECITGSTDGGIPSAFYKLTHGQTLISDTDKIWDARQWINVPTNDSAGFTSTATATVTNTTGETSIIGTGVGSLTLAANSLVAGRTIRLRLRGILSTLAVLPGTLNIKVKFGSTTIVSTGAVSLSTSLSGAMFTVEAEITCRSVGASGTVMGQGEVDIINALAITAEQLSNGTSTITIDTTSSLVIDVTATFGTASASNTISGTNAIMEIIN